MVKGKLLIIEDDKNISKLIKYNLERADYSCEAVITGEEAFDILEENPYDHIILDIMLPKMDGLEVCKKIKADPRFNNIPIIILTAKGEEVDRIVGFELGADDYMVKPFSPRELVLRAKAVLKRGRQPQEKKRDILEFDQIKINIPKHKVTVDREIICLTSMEFKLLVTLLERQGRVQSRGQLLADVWGINAEVTTRTIDTHVKRLRKKMGKMGRHIETVRGYGYRFKDPEM